MVVNRLPYRPLHSQKDEIRVLELLPGNSDSPLRGQLIHVTLSGGQQIQYDTISYCWGDSVAHATIEINGLSVRVPDSALQALRTVRQPHERRILWIDSICNDRTDVEERGSQVSLMYKVYDAARTNLIWLGDDDGTFSDALRGFTALGEEIQVETSSHVALSDILYTKTGERRRHPATSFDVECNIPAMVRFLSRPWFQRVWTIQEAALAAKNICLCGQGRVDLDLVLKVIAWLMYKRNVIPSNGIRPSILWHALRMSDMMNLKSGLFSHESFQKAPLKNLLSAVKCFKAADPRDHVYGILGMYRRSKSCPEMLPQQLVPDYERSEASIYADATRLCIQETASLDVLQDVLGTVVADSSSDLPSWVPAWDRPFDQRNDERYLASYFKAGLRDNVQLVRPSGLPWDVLGVQDLSIDTIDSVTETYRKETWKNFMLCAAATAASHPAAATQAHPEQCLSTMLMADCNHDYEKAGLEDISVLGAVIASLQEAGEPSPLLQRDYTPDDDVCTMSGDEQAVRVVRACNRMCRRRRFFVTKQGRLGLGPERLRTGDPIAVLYGSKWPFVLRGPHEGGTYEYIGMSYVHGIMYGEATCGYEKAFFIH